MQFKHILQIAPKIEMYLEICFRVVVVQSLSYVLLLATLQTAAHLASLSHYLPEFAQTHIH